jgi:hypothetical protein
MLVNYIFSIFLRIIYTHLFETDTFFSQNTLFLISLCFIKINTTF